MTTINFKSEQQFVDPLNDDLTRVKYSTKFVRGTIFNQEFALAERAKAEKQKTIVFDFDGTLRGWDNKNQEGFLRHYLKKVLAELKNKGYRLVIWSASNKDSIQQTLNKYPDFEEYFDLIISAENYSYPFVPVEDREFLRTDNPAYFKLMLEVKDNPIKASNGMSIYRPPKNINFLNYSIIVEDDPVAMEEARDFSFSCIQVFSYTYENPDVSDVPEEVVEQANEDFKNNMVDRIVAIVENKPLVEPQIYIA